MPTCSDGQLTFLQANQTRFVTKVRCVVEVINGIFDQSFSALKKIRNTMIPHIMTDFKIAAALIKCFHSRFLTDKSDWEQIALSMKKKLNTRNEFENRLSKPKRFVKKTMSSIDAFELNDFPKLDLDQIRKNITFGSYQIKQSIGYVSDHLNQDGQFKILINDQIESVKDDNIIYAEVQSRHSSNTEYTVLIRYTTHIDCPTSIKAWGCTCHSGLRTVGCCSHVASIIYFLSYAKHLEEN